MFLERTDLGLIRFARSPLHETVWSLKAINDPVPRPSHQRWQERAGSFTAPLDLEVLPILTGDGLGWPPYFLLPSPGRSTEPFAAEVEQVRATQPGHVRRDLVEALDGRPLPAGLTKLHDDPDAVLPGLCAELVRYHRRVIEPIWPRVSALLEADVIHRARQLTEGGLVGLFAGLDDRLAYRADRLEISTPAAFDCRHRLRGIGVLLLPSAFLPRGPSVIPDPPYAPMISYPARGAGELWQSWDGPEAACPALHEDRLGDLVGRSRALMLGRLDVPMTTTQLAGQLGISAPSVSEHLAILRRSRLVTATRSGRQVFYRRTPLAEVLLDKEC